MIQAANPTDDDSISRSSLILLTGVLNFRTQVRLHLCFRRVGDSYGRHEIWHVKACHANPVVGHPVIDIEAVRCAEIVAPVDAGGEHDVRDSAVGVLASAPASIRASQNDSG